MHPSWGFICWQIGGRFNTRITGERLLSENPPAAPRLAILLSIHTGFLSFQVKTGFCGGYDYKSIILIKPGAFVKAYTNYYISIKFESFNIKNGLMNAKKVQIAN